MSNGNIVSTEKVKKALQKNNGKQDTVADLIEKLKPQMALALPKHINADRFYRVILTEFRKNPDLIKCTPVSLMGALLTSAQLGLEPGLLGQAYLVPYKGQMEFQIGYRGMIDLARRSKNIKVIYAEGVYENDEFDYEYGLNFKLFHKPVLENKGNLIAVYGVSKFVDGGEYFKVMSKEDVDKIKKLSKTVKSPYSPWNNFYDDMAKKTVIRQIFKYLPISVEILENSMNDNIIKKNDGRENMSQINESDIINLDLEPVEEEPQKYTEPKQRINREESLALDAEQVAAEQNKIKL